MQRHEHRPPASSPRVPDNQAAHTEIDHGPADAASTGSPIGADVVQRRVATAAQGRQAPMGSLPYGDFIRRSVSAIALLGAFRRTSAPENDADVRREGKEEAMVQIDAADDAALLLVYERAGGLSSADAVAMLESLTATTFSAAFVCAVDDGPDGSHVAAPETPTTPDGATVPDAVHLGTSRNNRAYMLDWDSRDATLSPAAAAGTTPQSTMRAVFNAHRDQQIRDIFGPDANLHVVQPAITLATSAGRPDVAAQLRAALFRANQYAVVATLNVSRSARYQPGGDKTYCNIYAHDVVTALGGYLPRVWWYDAIIRRIQAGARTVSRAEYARMQGAGESVAQVIRPDYGTTVREMGANSLTAWMREWGAYFGWAPAADAAEAQGQANGGRVVIVLAANADAQRSGHVTVVLAEDATHRAHRNETGEVVVPLQSQAGSRNFNFSDPAATSGQSSWWNDASHRNGGFWVFIGATRSPLVTPEALGAER